VHGECTDNQAEERARSAVSFQVYVVDAKEELFRHLAEPEVKQRPA
jgi:hypothetical protein